MSLRPPIVSLRDRISQLDGSREECEPAFSLARITGADMQFARIRSLSHAEGEQASLLPFVRGLWTLQAPWSMLAIGRPGEVGLYVGSIASNVGWTTVLESSLSNSEVLHPGSSQELIAEMGVLSTIAALTGNPYSANDKQSPLMSPTELIARSLPNERWAYLVLARPIAGEIIRETLLAVRKERTEVASNFQRQGSAEENNHPTAQHLLDLLKAAAQHHEVGVQIGMWKLAACLLAPNERILTAAVHASFAALARGTAAPQPLRCRRFSASSPCALTPLTSVEAAIYAALPTIELAGVSQIEPVCFSVNAPPVQTSNRVACGLILDQRRRTPNWFEVDRDDLTRHVFICGTTGSGKTRTCQSLLQQLWLEHRVPWLVIEPAMKSEYRELLSSELGADLLIYTPGKPDVAPFRINPLDRVAGVSVDAHIDALVGLFSAAFSLVTPMSFVLRLALQRLFEGANLPTLVDLQRVVGDTITGLGYQGELGSNLRAALELRLQTMSTGAAGQVLNAGTSTAIDHWLNRPTVIELSALGDDATRALVMGALLLRLVQTRQQQGLLSSLRHVAVVEEAHRLLGRRTPNAESVDANDHATEAFAHLLAEVRAFGQGLVVVDQSPAKLISDVIRNTQLKIVHRLTSSDDQAAVAAAMGLDESQQRSLASLGVGEAVAFATRSVAPSKTVVPDWRRQSTGARLVMPDDARVARQMRSLVTSEQTTISGSLGCNACPEDSSCATGRAVQKYLLERDESAAIAIAFSSGLTTLRSFGSRVAANIGLGSSSEAARCVVLQIARVIGVPAETIEQLRRRLT